MQKAIIDLSKNGIIPVFHAKQGDTSRRVAITLLDNGLPYDTAADAVSVWYRGPSGEGNYSDGIDKDGSTLTILVNQNMTAASGRNTCAVMLSNESGRCTTWNFCVEVAYTPALGSEEAKAYFEAFEAGELAADIAAVDARTAKAVAELNARVSAIIASGTATEGNTELIDIRTGADGKVYQTAGDAVREQVGGIKSDLDNIERVVKPSTDYLNFNTGTAGTGAMSNAKKFVYNSPVPKDIHFDKLSIRCRYQASATKIYVQFWKMTNDDGVYKTLECVNTVVTDVDTSSTGYKEVKIDYTTTEENYISIWADNPCLDYYTVTDVSAWGVKDTTLETITVSDSIRTTYVFNGSFTQHKVLDVEAISETSNEALNTANLNTAEIAKIKGNLITIGENGDFTNIQDAIDYLANNVLDTAENHWTIIVYPGTYPRFTTKHARWNAYSTRYISIIGIDKSQCIVKDDSGEYNTPPAETRLYGELKNLQFIATHDNPPDVAERENAKHKAYAVHMDMGTQKLLVEDCVFTSYQAPAVGIGIWKDSEIKFKNCEFYSLGDEYTAGTDDYKTNYTYLTNHGAFFAHANMSESSGGGSAKLILENCKAYSKSGNKVYAINKSAQWYAGNTEFIVECINNNGWSDLEGIGSTSIIETGEDAITLTGNSYGNNVENMNAQTN